MMIIIMICGTVLRVVAVGQLVLAELRPGKNYHAVVSYLPKGPPFLKARGTSSPALRSVSIISIFECSI